MKTLKILLIVIAIMCLATASDARTYISSDQTCSIQIPSSYQPSTYAKHLAPSIEVSNGKGVVAVFATDNQDFDNFKLKEVPATWLTNMKETEGVTKVSIITSSQMIINNYGAIQFEARATIDGYNIVFLITVVETRKRVYEIDSWATVSTYDKEKANFKAIASSFRELR